ncbi:MAG: LysR substrate-binding domain-containing protein, partial [Pseudomonadota bacterium]
DGRVDIGIASQAQASPDLQAKQLLAEHFVLVCSVDNPLVSSELPITWARLEGERFIAHGLLNLIDHAKIKALVAEPAVTVHNITSIVSFVERGLGVTLLPSLAAPKSDAIAVLPLEDTSVTRNIRLLTRDSLSPAAAILAELISSRARDISLAGQR